MLMHSVEVAADREQPPGVYPPLEIRFKDGRAIERHVAFAKGAPENPLSDARVPLPRSSQVEPVLGAARCKSIMDTVASLEDVSNARELLALLTSPRTATWGSSRPAWSNLLLGLDVGSLDHVRVHGFRRFVGILIQRAFVTVLRTSSVSSYCSSLTLPALITFANVAVSALMSAVNFSGSKTIGSNPRLSSFSLISGVAMIFSNSARSFPRFSFGLATGANAPNQVLRSNAAHRLR